MAQRPAPSSTRQIVSPIDGNVCAEYELLDDAAVAQLAELARIAQAAWASTPLTERLSIGRLFVELFSAQSTEVAKELAVLMGRPISFGPGEVKGVVERASYLVDIAVEALAEERFEDQAGFDRWISREPLGTVFVVAPWNYPYLTAINSVMPALLAGNAVLLKHASQTTPCANRLADTFSAAGLPDNLLTPLQMSHTAAATLIGGGKVDQVVLTGSVRAGKSVQQAAADRFIGVATELGGKDPAYVRADADITTVVPNLVEGAFFNSGQSCCAVERIYVHESLFDRFVERFVSETNKLVLGDPLSESTTIGPMVNAKAASHVNAQVSEAVVAGAKTLIDPTSFQVNNPGPAYLAPQVLVDVTHDMEIMSEETFGPAIGIMSVSNDSEAVQLMNDSRYGLSASVWSTDVEAVIAIDNQLETGTVFMNRCDYLDPALAWVGIKDTGRGTSLSKLGFHALTRPKSHHYRVN